MQNNQMCVKYLSVVEHPKQSGVKLVPKNAEVQNVLDIKTC